MMKLHDYTFEEITSYLHSMIDEWEWKKVAQDADIHPEFSCFADTYYHLSQIIPKDYIVIDFGAAYNSQAYFFTNHKKFIAVNPPSVPGNNGMFKPFNCEIYRLTTGEFLKTYGNFPDEKVFAICNYVPNWHGEDSIDLVHKNFRNVYTFYPSGEIDINL